MKYFITLLLIFSWPQIAWSTELTAVECYENETICLEKLSSLATRDGDVLSLKMGDGRVLRFKSRPSACQNDDAANCIGKTLAGYRQGFFIIMLSYYEGESALMVRASDGAILPFKNRPHFSPNENLFVVVGSQAYVSYSTASVIIYAIQKGNIHKVYTIPKAHDTGWFFIDWTRENEILLEAEDSERAAIQLLNSKWNFEGR